MKNLRSNWLSVGLTCQIRELWSFFTKTTTRRDLSDKIVALKSRLERLKNDILNIIQLIESICVDDEDGTRTPLISGKSQKQSRCSCENERNISQYF